jgi:AraC family transcriptional regulator
MNTQWTSTDANTVSAAGLRIMHGGPIGMELPEHEHVEAQVEVHFRRPAASGEELLPAETELIAPLRRHCGFWEDESEVIVILIPPHYLEMAADELHRGGGFEVMDRQMEGEPLFTAVASSLRARFRDGAGVSRLLAESAGYLVAEHILRTHAVSNGCFQEPKGRLSGRDVRRVTEFVDDHLDGTATIAEMAAICLMGPHRFRRMFKSAVGCTPYQFVQSRRIRLAQKFLLEREAGIAEIALRLGFASQSHFTAAFRKMTGTTPRRYRAERGMGQAGGLHYPCQQPQMD